MQFIFLSGLFTLFSFYSLAQKAHDMRVGIHADLIKSDNDGFFEKVQAGVEVNYFLGPQFSASGGLEWWTPEDVSLAIGMRWWPVEEAFIRIRGLVGEQDLSLGAGFSKPLQNNFHLEAIADLYFAGHLAIRGGIAYIIK